MAADEMTVAKGSAARSGTRTTVCPAVLPAPLMMGLIAAMAIWTAAPAEAAPLGALTQFPGAAGCFSQSGNDTQGNTCQTATGMAGAGVVVASPDGKQVYSVQAQQITIFNRDAVTGGLVQPAAPNGCIQETASADPLVCNDGGKYLVGQNAAVMSPNGSNLYTAGTSGRILSFTRNTSTGALTYLSCLNAGGGGDDPDCPTAPNLYNPGAMVASPDGANVYVANGNGVFTLTRGAGGALAGSSSPSACITEDGTDQIHPLVPGVCLNGKGLWATGQLNSLAISPLGDTVYASANGSQSIAILPRDLGGNLTELDCVSADGTDAQDDMVGTTCTAAPTGGALNPYAITVSSDGETVYTAGPHQLRSFSRNTSTGALGEAGCLTDTAIVADCTLVKGLTDGSDIKGSADGKTIYVGGTSLGSFSRAADGALTQIADPFGCHEANSSDGAGNPCTAAPGVYGVTTIAVGQPDDSKVYTGSQSTAAVAQFTRALPGTATTGGSLGTGTNGQLFYGTINPNGTPTRYHFDYGPTDTYGSVTSDGLTGSGTAPVEVSEDAAFVNADVIQHYRIHASGSTVIDGADYTTAVTLAASPAAATSTTLHGKVNPDGRSMTYHFEYGPTTSYGQVTPTVPAGNGQADVDADVSIAGLTPGTDYHFRIVADSGFKTGTGRDMPFSTPGVPAVDSTDPTVTITSPTSGTHYPLDSELVASYLCQDEAGGSGIASCAAAAPSGGTLDTSVGSTDQRFFSVTARDNAGHETSALVGYFIDPAPESPPVSTDAVAHLYRTLAAGQPEALIAVCDPVRDTYSPLDCMDQVTVEQFLQLGATLDAIADPASNVGVKQWLLAGDGTKVAKLTVFDDVIAAGSGNFVYKVIAAGANNVIAAGANNFTIVDAADKVIAAGAGNLLENGFGGFEFDSGGKLIASAPVNSFIPDGTTFVVSQASVIAAGANNVIAAGAGNVIASGSGNVIAPGANNVIAAGAHNVIASGSGSLATTIGFKGASVSKTGMPRQLASITSSMLSPSGGVYSTSMTLPGRHKRALVLGTGQAKFAGAGRQTVTMKLTLKGRTYLAKLATANRVRRAHHQRPVSIKVTTTAKFKPTTGKGFAKTSKVKVTPG